MLVPAGGNLTPVFNIVGSEIDPLTRAVRVVADWVVGGSLILPPGKNFVTFTATVTDNRGNAGTAQRPPDGAIPRGTERLQPKPSELQHPDG